jgi:hypothetical protein
MKLFCIAFLVFILTSSCTQEQVTLVSEIKISDSALYFDGEQQRISENAVNRQDGKYDYAFGRRITPHGDCIKKYGDYLFLTWYKGGKENRQVMLTRHNLAINTSVTIEFPHQHTGFHNQYFIGESHNTIAVGICPRDETIHLLYDMHSYSPARPRDGSLANDYFRYSVSQKNVATLPDNEFTLDKFYPKRLYLKEGENYESLTYPAFFVDTEGNLFVKMREGGHTNGKFMLAKYDGNEWSGWSDFNVLNAKNYPEMEYNWGLYGSFNYLNDKFHIGFAIRNSKVNKYVHNNGIYYAWSKDPVSNPEWFNVKGERVDTPLVDPSPAFIAEPGDEVPSDGESSVNISSSSAWTITERGDIHFITSNVRGANNTNVNVHTYRKAGDSEFTITTDSPGGSLERIGNNIYIIGLNDNGHPYIKKAEGGTNNWVVLYEATSGRAFHHGNVHIADGKIFYYLMKKGSGNAQPIYVQVYDLNMR